MKRGNVSYRLLDRYLGIPVLCAAAVVNRRRPCPVDFKTIGILASPTLGDTLLTSAAVLDLRNAYPASHITYFASPGARPAARLIPGIDVVHPIDITQPLLTLRAIRHSRLDLLIDFSQWQRVTALYSGLSGAKFRLGFISPGQSRHWLYDGAVEHSAHIHEIDNFRCLLRALGIQPSNSPTLKVDSNNEEASKRAIVFHPWASGQRAHLREWGAVNWVALAVRLVDSFAGQRLTFFITGSHAEAHRSRHLASALQDAGLPAEAFTGGDGLAPVSRLLKHAELVVSVNTGIMHLAAILGAPTIGLNGPTASHRWGPVGPNVRSVEPRGGGGGFLHFGFEFDGQPTDTMRRIHVDDVVAAAQSLMPKPYQSAAHASMSLGGPARSLPISASSEKSNPGRPINQISSTVRATP